MGDVIDRWRLNKGWNPLDDESQFMAISSWVNVMDSENVPANAYGELFIRALKLRAALFSQGKQPPDMGIELMLSCWESLRIELVQKQISEKRSLPETAATQCPRCFGTGSEYIYSDHGEKLGCRPNCKHAALEVGEWLWKKAQIEAENGEQNAE